MEQAIDPETVVYTTPTRTAVLPGFKRQRYRGNRQAAAERQFLAVREAINRGSAPQPKEQNNAS